MNFHLHHLGEDLGVHSEETLRRRHGAGELTGAELVWRPGMSGWERLDLVLPPLSGPTEASPPVLGGSPAPRPRETARPAGNRTDSPAFWITATIGLFAGFVGLATLLAGAFGPKLGSPGAIRTGPGPTSTSVVAGPKEDAGDDETARIVGEPLRIPGTSRTHEQRVERDRRFLVRHYLEARGAVGEPKAPATLDDQAFLGAWIENQLETLPPKGREALMDDRRKRMEGAAPQDPLVWIACALLSRDDAETFRLFGKADTALQGSPHGAYPRFRAAAGMFRSVGKDDPRRGALADEAVTRFAGLFGPGGLSEEDQEYLAEGLLEEWGKPLFQERAAGLVAAARQAGDRFAWLADVMEGEQSIDLAWKARGTGFADTVTQKGFKGFEKHLEDAEKALSRAWERKPEWPRAAARMVTVSMGRHGAEEMRLWFGRAVEAEMNHPAAWDAFLFGLRPRWHGDRQALLAVGKAAVGTGRFDTGVPKRLFDAIETVEADLVLPPGRRILGDDDVWPLVDSMYRGYTTNSQGNKAGWRTVYAVVAHIAGHHQTAREQLEALDWKPDAAALRSWNQEEGPFLQAVRLRTGPGGETLVAVESMRRQDFPTAAWAVLKTLDDQKDLTPEAKSHAEDLRRLLSVEMRLEDDKWVPFHPVSKDDPLWRLGGGTIEEAGPSTFAVRLKNGSHTAYSRFRVGSEFEVRGEFEVVSTSNGDFQAGLVFGHPDSSGRGWRSVRFKRNAEEGTCATIAQAWSRTQILRPAPLEPKGPNRFRFRLENGRATLDVNGKRIYHNEAFPNGPAISDEDYEVGIGAYNRDFESVVRYRNVEIRRL